MSNTCALAARAGSFPTSTSAGITLPSQSTIHHQHPPCSQPKARIELTARSRDAELDTRVGLVGVVDAHAHGHRAVLEHRRLRAAPLSRNSEFLAFAHVLGDEHRQPARFGGFDLRTREFGCSGCDRARLDCRIALSALLINFRDRTEAGTHLGLFLAALPSLLTEARLLATALRDLVPLGDEVARGRAQLIHHHAAQQIRRRLSQLRVLRQSKGAPHQLGRASFQSVTHKRRDLGRAQSLRRLEQDRRSDLGVPGGQSGIGGGSDVNDDEEEQTHLKCSLTLTRSRSAASTSIGPTRIANSKMAFTDCERARVSGRLGSGRAMGTRLPGCARLDFGEVVAVDCCIRGDGQRELERRASSGVCSCWPGHGPETRPRYRISSPPVASGQRRGSAHT